MQMQMLNSRCELHDRAPRELLAISTSGAKKLLVAGRSSGWAVVVLRLLLPPGDAQNQDKLSLLLNEAPFRYSRPNRVASKHDLVKAQR
jgi:hypothetical protein